jgi:aminoglycoside phosphotransferase (APT) family kinase protein
MDSLTKRKVSADEIQALAAKAFPGAEVRAAQELTDGWFNAVYVVELADGRETVLKVAPPPGTRMLRYEDDLMRAELEYFERCTAAGVAVPAVLYADTSRELIESDWLFMTKLHGRTIADLCNDLGEEAPEVLEARRALGTEMARMHSIVGSAFGYPNPRSRSRQATWRGSFLAMIDDVLCDATELGVTLPRPAPELAELCAAHADALDAVHVPRLVHYDPWDKNVFVVERDGAPAIEGIIDGERCFYGDPLAEFVGLARMEAPEFRPTLLDAYERAADWTVERDDAARRRLALYRIYLALIMFTEGPTRGFAGPTHQGHLDWAGGYARTELALLDGSRVTQTTPRARARHDERIAS